MSACLSTIGDRLSGGRGRGSVVVGDGGGRVGVGDARALREGQVDGERLLLLAVPVADHRDRECVVAVVGLEDECDALGHVVDVGAGRTVAGGSADLDGVRG